MISDGRATDSGTVAAVDMFCGVGGLTYGLQSAGIKVAAGYDIDPKGRYPYEANCRSSFVEADIRDVKVDEVRDHFGNRPVRVLAGCAPCQPFSTYSQSKRTKDDQWRLLSEFQRLALGLRPEILTVENVRGLQDHQVWKNFLATLVENGYHFDAAILRCEEFGIPQTRRRLVLIASRLGPIKVPRPRLLTEQRTVRDAIAHLPKIEAGGVDPSDPLHQSSRVSSLNMQRLRASRPGGTWRDWPDELRSGCHARKTGETYPSVYGRMEWDSPSPTITTQFYGFGNGRFGHPSQDRAISIREAALLQSFPEKYDFVAPTERITFRNVGVLVGNAVPPRLGEAIGHAIMEHVQSSGGGVL